jgi:hypothetical protein
MALSEALGRFIEGFFRTWVRVFGKRIEAGEAAWLDGPVGDAEHIGAGYYERLLQNPALLGRVNEPGSGLMNDFGRLRGAAFDPAEVDARVRDFYERTTDYRLDAWAQWSWPFRPFAWLLVTFVSRRIGQLNLPLGSLETSRGMSSDVIQLVEREGGRLLHTCWLRKAVSTGNVVYAGFYSTCRPPNYDGGCVKVVFPLPRGNTTVVLRPVAHADGSFELRSEGWRFGDPGYYRVLQLEGGARKVRLIRAFKESIHVYADQTGTLRTDHVFRFWSLVMLRLHYKINPAPEREIELIS